MGGRKKNRDTKVNRFAQKKRDNRSKAAAGEDVQKHERPYSEVVRENDNFVKYYKRQQICPDSEWDAFLAAMKSDLPTTFRITGSKKEAQALLAMIRKEFFEEYFKGHLTTDDGTPIEKPSCLSWYPNEMGWQLQLSRKYIRRSEALFRLHNFLISETASGNISRQEAVSMIPPLVMDVQPHHNVLDMCAAPGSKTAQLIEALHSSDDGAMPTGCVVANDLDNNRCYMLVHQAKRLNSPCCLITNNDGGAYPNIQVKNEKGQLEVLKFDRILCDAPCSGDGTMRKNPDIWNKWSVAQGGHLHGVQYRCAKRGAEMLKIGGRLVYSTCSLNPVENEAVVSRMLRESEGALQLIDASKMLPTLKHDKGLTHWEPATKDMEFYKTFQEVPEKFKTVVHVSLFPPTAEEVAKFNLDRCIRILPHHQNTGGFFVAAFEKVGPLPWESSKKKATATGADDDASEPSGEPPKKKRRPYGYREDPFVFFDKIEPLWQEIKGYYEMSEDFNPECLLTRCKIGKKKNIYLASETIRNIVVHNEESIKIINTGVKTFSRCDNKHMACPFRLAQEGLDSVKQFIGAKRRITVTREDLVLLLQNTDPMNPPDLNDIGEVTREQMVKLDLGSCVLQYSDENLNLLLVGWRGARTMRAYVDQADTVHMLRLLGADVSKYEKNKFKKDAPEDEPEPATAEVPENTTTDVQVE